MFAANVCFFFMCLSIFVSTKYLSIRITVVYVKDMLVKDGTNEKHNFHVQ